MGDAAGAVSPLTAGGLDPCLRLSEHAADILDEALRTGRRDALERYDGAALRAGFRGRLLLRRALTRVRSPAVATAGFTLLRTPVGRVVARGILFGDRSFPAPGAAWACRRPRSTTRPDVASGDSDPRGGRCRGDDEVAPDAQAPRQTGAGDRRVDSG